MKLKKKDFEEIRIKNQEMVEKYTPKSTDRIFEEEKSSNKIYINRDEISKDRDRIIYSKSFRRLQHKAQIYSNKKGDHYRTRLTHSLQVAQISRTVAKSLSLNEELAETISLGHDIGHTPFGHVGEEILDLVMRSKDNLSNKIRPDFNQEIDFGGFKHNFFSLKVLCHLEMSTHKSLNLTWQVLEGILKHTKIEKNGYKWNLNRFMKKVNNGCIKKSLKYPHSVTLEGQVVNISDEIAQRHHDLDDGLREDKLSINIEILIDEIIKILEKDPQFEYEKKFSSDLKQIKTSLNPDDIKKQDKINKKFLDNLINYLITDVIYNSFKNLKDYYKSNKQENFFKEKLVLFSNNARDIDKLIEDNITTKILNSYNVNRFDGKSRFVIRELFKAYYANPRQMPSNNLIKLVDNIKENKKYYELNIKNPKYVEKNIFDICFEKSPRNLVNSLISLLKLENFDNELFDLPKYDKIKDMPKEDLEKILGFDDKAIMKPKEKYYKFLLECHYCYLSAICDYIAQMTDDFANKEFKELYF